MRFSSNATLVYDEARSVNPSETENLIIEGENLEVLKLLSTAYREKLSVFTLTRLIILERTSFIPTIIRKTKSILGRCRNCRRRSKN